MPLLDPSLPEENRLCLKCGYSLEEIESSLCPECGRPFSPDDPRTFRYNERKWIPWVRIMGLYVPLAIAGGSYAYLFLIIVPQLKTWGSVGGPIGFATIAFFYIPILIAISIIVGILLGFLFDWIQRRKHVI